jgi:predicted nucleic acid-binding protein
MTVVERSAQAAVIDTNIWLDWLVFDDPSVTELKRSAMTIFACQHMRGELADVLQRSQFSLTPEQQAKCLETFDNRICLREQPAQSRTRLQCSDRADQKFLELAIHTGSRLLLTQDKALLKLARRAVRDHQLLILTASQWMQTDNREPGA